MRTVCVLCVYICTLTVSVQFSRGQPGNQSVQTVQTSPEPLPETDVLTNHIIGKVLQDNKQTDKQTAVFIEVAPQLKKDVVDGAISV